MRIVFLGTPAFAVPSLAALARQFEVVGVVTQPDRPAGRGRRLQSPPIKIAALDLGLPLLQPGSLSSDEAITALRGWEPDLIVVAAYGQILRKPVLDLPARGCLNVHASLLPRWRGASPIQHALLSGDGETGLTLMKMDEGMDTGPIVARRVIRIRDYHTAETLEGELAVVGAQLLADSLKAYLAGDLRPIPQDNSLATYAPRLKRLDGLMDPRRTAQELQQQVRALNPRPGTYLRWGDKELAVLRARLEDGDQDGPAGAVAERAGFPALATGRGWLILESLQLPGRKPLDGKAFLRGQPGFLGSRLAVPTS